LPYPSYVDLDRFIDVDRLTGLDGFITDRLTRRLAAPADPKFYTGPFLLDAAAAGPAGVADRSICRGRARRMTITT
jgi:hypothetical protein